MQYDKIKQISEDTVLASYLAPQKEVKAPQMPGAVIYPFGLNQSQKLAVERALSSKISIIQGPPGTGKTQTILNIIANVVRSGKTVAVVSNNNSATHNVAEKLEKKNASFLTAFLGSLANKQKFLENQNGTYPDMSDWEMPPEERQQLDQETTALSKELNEMLNAKNRIAEIEQEFLQLNPEQHYFEEYYATYSGAPTEGLDKLSSQKILALWMEFEQHAEHASRLGLFQKLSIMFRFNRNALKLFLRSPELVIPYLQSQFYSVKRRELEAEKQELNRKLEHYAFDTKMDELTQKSLRLFRAELTTRYHWQSNRQRFEMSDFRRNSAEFTREYPVVLSTTYSIKGTLSIDHIYDYLIVDTPNVEFSFDVAITTKNKNGNYMRLIHNKNVYALGLDQYTWNEVPNSHQVKDRADKLKRAGLWQKVRDRYLEKKNMYLFRPDHNHPSFVVYVEAVNEVYSRYFNRGGGYSVQSIF